MKRSRHPQGGKRRQDDDGVAEFRDLGPKLRGQHRWIAHADFALTHGMARSAMSAVPPLEPDRLIAVTVKCHDCGGQFDEVGEERCLVEPEDVDE